jgi:hypothetical protein
MLNNRKLWKSILQNSWRGKSAPDTRHGYPRALSLLAISDLSDDPLFGYKFGIPTAGIDISLQLSSPGLSSQYGTLLLQLSWAGRQSGAVLYSLRPLWPSQFIGGGRGWGNFKPLRHSPTILMRLHSSQTKIYRLFEWFSPKIHDLFEKLVW